MKTPCRRLIPALSLLTFLTMSCTSYASARPMARNSGQTNPVALFSEPEQGIIARDLVDDFKYETLEQSEEKGLTRASASQQPWSGWFWPFNEAALASRYADPHFPLKGSWTEIRTYLENSIGKGPISDHSPAEKYDLLVGDPQFTLTFAMLKAANNQVKNGTIEPWIGYCRGLAAASIFYPRPRRSVTLTAADGVTRLEFRPDDIKALGTLLWATGVFPFKSAGKPCTEEPIRLDPATGRPLDLSCREVNPATLHLALVNQFGLKGRALLIDADPGYEIWNHAVQSYTYRYFNPATEKFDDLAHATVAVEDYKSDKFAGLRAPETRSIVGIELQLTFIYVKEPEARSDDSPENDVIRLPIYRYDLELDSSGKIIGGEWHTRLRPDVLWLPVQSIAPDTAGDRLLDQSAAQWNPAEPVPAQWITAARQGARRSQPLRRIVDALFAISNK